MIFDKDKEEKDAAIRNDVSGAKENMLSIAQRFYPKPEPYITPEQAQRARFSAAISDSMASLAAMYGHGKGAIVQKNTQPSGQMRTAATLSKLEKYYQDEMRARDNYLNQAAQRDYLDLLSERRVAAQNKRQDERQAAQNLYNEKQLKARNDEAEARRKSDMQAKKDFEQWKYDNITVPTLGSRHTNTISEIGHRAAVKGGGGGGNGSGSGAKPAARNKYVKFVDAGTPGARYDASSGKYYVEHVIDDYERRAMLSGRDAYAKKNGLWNNIDNKPTVSDDALVQHMLNRQPQQAATTSKPPAQKKAKPYSASAQTAPKPQAKKKLY